MEYQSENNMEAGIMQGVIGSSQKKHGLSILPYHNSQGTRYLGPCRFFASPLRSLDCSVLFVTEFVGRKLLAFSKGTWCPRIAVADAVVRAFRLSRIASVVVGDGCAHLATQMLPKALTALQASCNS